MQWKVSNNNTFNGALDVPLYISFASSTSYCVFISINNKSGAAEWMNIIGVSRKNSNTITLNNNHTPSQPYYIFAIGY